MNGREIPIQGFIINNPNDVFADFGAGTYQLEPFSDVTYQLPEYEELYGEWEIVSLDSNDEGYLGSKEDMDWIKNSYANYDMNALVGSDFSISETLGKKVYLEEKTIKVLEEETAILEFSREVYNLKEFEEENQIWDGLSINNEEVEVIWIHTKKENIPLIMKDADNMLMHIGEGWFLLTRSK